VVIQRQLRHASRGIADIQPRVGRLELDLWRPAAEPGRI